ncbi:hypothetical protein OF83DRAFT_1094906, partial [Amylostereum chailletii]
ISLILIDMLFNGPFSYDPVTGKNALGVEFAGTAVTSSSPLGADVSPAVADEASKSFVTVNNQLQWSEASYRGFFTLTVNPSEVMATYYAMNNISNPNLDGFASAQFVVRGGENKLRRPVAGGKVDAGVLKSTVLGH